MDESISSTGSMKAAQPEARIGSYRVLEPVGTGGMSSVFRAVHVETNQEVALKVLTRSLARNATLLQRFMREARSAATLEHPNIVAIYDRGIDSGRHYLALEYVAGGDFHEYIQRHGPLSLAEAVAVIKNVAAGLKYAANRGLIHRDVKPSNILRTQNGQIKIIDLGLALQNEFEDERVTREGTTVGTVDYMAPEQARDSRATSIQSDMYSLGCTFYYLLCGVPPFPGGDITDKLTRHAKNPPPDVRDLRPDLPAELSAILLKLMSKRPEDRFSSYDDLTAKIDAVPLEGGSEAPGITLAPASASAGDTYAGYGLDISQVHRNDGSHTNGSAEATIPLIALVELAGDEAPKAIRERAVTRQFSREHSAVVERRVGEPVADPALSVVSHAPLPEPASRTGNTIPISSWILPGLFLCGALVILGIGVLQFMAANDAGAPDAAVSDERDSSALLDRQPASSPRGNVAGAMPGRQPPDDQAVTLTTGTPGRSKSQTPAKWNEPPDIDTTGIESKPALPAATAARFLPDWARSPIPDRIDGPFVVVRRISDSSEPTTASSLHRALDEHIGGTVELADEGPLAVDDFRVTGETRLIRARPGFRPILRIDRSSQEAVRQQSAVLVLKGKSLTLDGLDLIVDMRELSRSQTAIFLCSGANLTLRNCSVTILNQTAGTPLALVRAESTGPRPTHVRLESCMIRGTFTEGFRLNAGSCEVALRDTVVLARGGPLVRVVGADASTDNRIFLVRSLVAGPGPVIDWTKKTAGVTTRSLVVRAFGSVFGRLHGSGIASVICSSDSSQAVSKQIDWFGQENLFAGWKGLFACGDDQIVTVPDLAAARSTWNGSDATSREILAPWAYPGELAAAAPAEFSSFVPNHREIVQHAARPRARLYEKALGAFSDPLVPDPMETSFESTARPPAMHLNKPGLLPPEMTDMSKTGVVPPRAPGAPFELTFNTEDARWKGDLGAFLRDRMVPSMTFARVRVRGSGTHRFTPVKLPRGLRLEIKVEPSAQADPPVWSPPEGATGTALIELEGGALFLTNVILRHESSAKLEHLIHVEDGHLVLLQCQFLAPASPDLGGDLIAFRSITTGPRPVIRDQPLFSFPIDRPVCRLVDCVLITGGRALHAELGRGLVALSQCAIAAGATAIELMPAKVARNRFDADLVLDHCTLTSERTIIRLDAWPGLAPGPDRPWLITSRNCAFLSSNGKPARETVLLRCDADALAKGAAVWQANDDAADVDWFVAVGEGPPPLNRARDVQTQWIQFWGRNHIGRVTGPRGSGSPPSVRFRERLRPGQALEPDDLILDVAYHPDRPELTVGANLARQRGIRGPAAVRQQVGPPL